MFDQQIFLIINFWPCISSKKRKELEIGNEFVLGHVGRFTHVKNQKFLVDIFNEILKYNPQSILIMVGTGEDENKIKKYVSELNLSSKIKFLGNRADVSDLYNAMDVFVLPSFYEGIPLVGIEAQLCDLPCFFSSNVSNEVKINKKSQFISLEQTAAFWAKKILMFNNSVRHVKIDNKDINKYNIKITSKNLEEYYLMLLNQKK